MVARRSVTDYGRALDPEGYFFIVGGFLSAFFQVVLLGALISSRGSQKLGIHAYDTNNRQDLDELAGLFEAGIVVPVMSGR